MGHSPIYVIFAKHSCGGNMKKLIKYIGRLAGLLIIVITTLVLITYINHKICLHREDKLFIYSGQIVEVNGYKIHVYTEGEGEVTIVFMSGGGTSCPLLDFKSLYTLLSDKYRIVVVEKAGYGFSDIVDIKRDIDSILSDTREAISKAGISGPFILMPHSLSGIEAIYWAQKYPDEVTAIIGLDMSVPELYKDYKINMPILKLSAFAANVGIIRFIPGIAESEAIRYGSLTEDEKELYKVVFYRRTATKTMLREVTEIKNNAIKVGEGKIPNIPLLIFLSNGKETGWDKDVWKNNLYNYAKGYKQCKIVELDSPHYVHDIEYEKIANETVSFIENLY